MSAFAPLAESPMAANRAVEINKANQTRFQRDRDASMLTDSAPLIIQKHLARLQETLKPTSVHHHCRCPRLSRKIGPMPRGMRSPQF